MNLLNLLKKYIPVNEQESRDVDLFIQFLLNNEDAFSRTNLAGHVTSSAIILNDKMTHMCMIHHKLYKSWGWVGGHNDGDRDCLKVSIKEAKEETGLTKVTPYNKDILGVDVIYVPNHIKKGIYVPDHLHLNVTYLLIASMDERLVVNEEETNGVQWFELDDVLNHVSEPRMIPIYKKLIGKVLKY
jgi:ADP-ribose pyrophosphatase YjhB (NUDIX family)